MIFACVISLSTTIFTIAPLGIIWLAICAIRRRPVYFPPMPKHWSKGIASAALLLPLLSGLLPLAGLYLLSWRAQHNLGHWPMYLLDDPQNFDFDDPWYDLCNCVSYFAWGLGGACTVLWIAIVLRFIKRAPIALLMVTPCLFLLSWLIFVHEPGQRFDWMLD